jgi:hypothetical protein
LIKPDILAFGQDMILASSASDTATTSKSGTSFAAPVASGAAALIREGIIKKAIAEFVPGSISYEQAWNAVTEPMFIDYVVPLLCSKPQGMSTSKDNNYGYGIPMLAQVAEMVNNPSGAAAGADLGMSSMVGMMMVVMMMGMMMKGMKPAMAKVVK